MVTASTQQSPLEKWKAGIAAAVGDPAWNSHDASISAAVSLFNSFLAGKAGYQPISSTTIKAMAWVESGAKSSAWATKPLQIGVVGDPGLKALLNGNEGGELILPPIVQRSLTIASAQSSPEQNIRAAIGYLLMRMANFTFQSVTVAGSKPFDVTVKAGDSLDRIARNNGSTTETMKRLNPGGMALRVGQVVKCQKASVQRQITGWRAITTSAIAARYNGGGDPNYALKLDYVLALLK